MVIFKQNSPEYDVIDWDTWQPGERATILFMLREKEILLIRKKRGLGAGKINGPGGRLDPGETPQECALREIREELGITPNEDITLRGRLSFQFTSGYTLLVHVFTGSDFSGEPVETDEAVPLWTTLDQIPYDEMWADDQVWLPHMLAGKGFLGRFLFDDDKLMGGRVWAWLPGDLINK